MRPSDKLKFFIIILIASTLSIFFLMGFVGISIKSEANENLVYHLDEALFVDPEITGPERLCIVFGGVIGEFSGNGNPSTDVYSWLIVAQDGTEIFNRTGGATFQNISIFFTGIGDYTISLSVRRGTENIHNSSKTVTVLQGPTLAILPDYLLCGGEPVTITALDPQTSNLDQFTFEWKNANGEVVGSENTLTVSGEGSYSISLFFTNSSGGQDCLINGSTYVGPPGDYQLNVSTTQACIGETVSISPNVPVSGAWTAVKEGEVGTIDLGSSFGLSLNTRDDLPGPGIYEIFFNVTFPNNPACSSERKTTLEVNEGPQFQSSLVQGATDCVSQNGAFSFTALTPLNGLEIKELGYLVSDIAQNQTLSIDNLSPGIYTLTTSWNNCTLSNIIIVPNENPVANQIYGVEEISEVCSETGISSGEIRITFSEGPFTGAYRVLREYGGEIESGIIDDEPFIEISVPSGNYALEVLDESGCSLPQVDLSTVPSINLVTFSVPEEINVCQTFDLIPATDQNLVFTLTTPLGEEIVKATDQPFVIDEPGIYSILAKSLDPDSGLCPRVRSFTASISEPIEFDVVLAQQDCFGNQVYEAELFNVPPESVITRWLNDSGDIVGRGLQWRPTSLGTFFLDVQPRGSGGCPLNPAEFLVEVPTLEVEVTLEAEPLCPDALFITIEMETGNDELVNRIEWVFIDPDGNITALTEFENERSIEAENEGSYEVIVYNIQGCELGRDLLLVMRSMDEVRPEVPSVNSICVERNFGETINPGTFDSYEWYYQGELIAGTPTFKPYLEGEYELIVYSAEGCSFSSTFSVIEECFFRIVFPTGMVLSDPERLFHIFVNDPVEEAQIWIHNRQGNLLYFCELYEIEPRVPFCQWDGTYRGQPVTAGTYTVTIQYRSDRFDLHEKITRGLVVIE